MAIPTVGMRESVGVSILTDIANRCNGQKGWRFTTRHMNGKRPVEFARNSLVAECKQTDAGLLWFVDYDTILSKNAFDLLHVDADIVAGIYPFLAERWDDRNPGKREKPEISFGAYRRHPSVKDAYECVMLPDEGCNEVMDVDAVCMGATIIKRRVLDDPRMLLGVAKKNPQIPCLFTTKRDINGEELETEDMDFCKRAKALDYTVKVHMGVRFGHLKNIDISRVFVLMTDMYQKGMKHAVA